MRRSVAPNGNKVTPTSAPLALTGEEGGGAAALCSRPHPSRTRPFNERNKDQVSL